MRSLLWEFFPGRSLEDPDVGALKACSFGLSHRMPRSDCYFGPDQNSKDPNSDSGGRNGARVRYMRAKDMACREFHGSNDRVLCLKAL